MRTNNLIKKILLLAIILIAILILSLLIWNFALKPTDSNYSKIILRDTHSNEEENVLTIAESLNYSNITSRERFIDPANPETYLHPSTYITYTTPNFIDSEVINYYSKRFDDLQASGDPNRITLNYEANVSKRSEFRIFNSPPPEGVTWRNTTLVISAPDGSLYSKSIGFMYFFYSNQTEYQWTNSNFDFNFSDCYVVWMKLFYSELYAPTAGYFTTTEQLLVLDRDLEPVLVGVSTGRAAA